MIPPIPPSGRYSPKLKAIILRCIEAGSLSEKKALSYYQISGDELAEWKTALGVDGVKATKSVKLRRKGARHYVLHWQRDKKSRRLIPVRIFQHRDAA